MQNCLYSPCACQGLSKLDIINNNNSYNTSSLMRLCILFLRPLSHRSPGFFTRAHPTRHIHNETAPHFSRYETQCCWAESKQLNSKCASPPATPRNKSAKCVPSWAHQAGSVSILSWTYWLIHFFFIKMLKFATKKYSTFHKKNSF